MKRHGLSKHGSRRMFSKHASHTHVKNLQMVPMRGGFRI